MADVDHLTELFAPLRGVTFRRMFSGYGIFKDGVMFALISRDLLYFRTDDAAAVQHAAEGAPQWAPRMRGAAKPMPYWQVPERLFDEPGEFAEWARRAFAVAARHKAEKASPKTRKPAKKKPVRKKKAIAKQKPRR